MKKRIAILVLALCGCTKQEGAIITDAGKLTADVLCLINQEDLSDEELQKVCDISKQTFDSFRARRAEAAKRAATLRKVKP